MTKETVTPASVWQLVGNAKIVAITDVPTYDKNTGAVTITAWLTDDRGNLVAPYRKAKK